MGALVKKVANRVAQSWAVKFQCFLAASLQLRLCIGRCVQMRAGPQAAAQEVAGSGHGDIADVVAPKIPQVQPVPDLHGIACHVFEHVSVHVFFNVGD